MNSISLTNLIAELHQFLDCFFVGMVLLAVIEADRVEHKVTVNMLPVDMSSDYDLVFAECFLRKLDCDFMGELGFDFIAAREALH